MGRVGKEELAGKVPRDLPRHTAHSRPSPPKSQTVEITNAEVIPTMNNRPQFAFCDTFPQLAFQEPNVGFLPIIEKVKTHEGQHTSAYQTLRIAPGRL